MKRVFFGALWATGLAAAFCLIGYASTFVIPIAFDAGEGVIGKMMRCIPLGMAWALVIFLVVEFFWAIGDIAGY